jgi:hypothetical protein
MRSSTDMAGSLANLQRCFSRKLLERSGSAPEGLIRSRRFQVYRNTMFASLIDALRARYPVIEKLVGEEFFKAAVGLYIEAEAPRSPVLTEYGEGFSSFLAGFEPARGLPYLADVARIEWLRHRAYDAADREAVKPADLACVPAERAFTLKFEFHPSAALISSAYPVVSIWEANAGGEEPRPIGPEMPGEAALIVRRGDEVLVVRLDDAERAFAEALEEGATLGEAAVIGAGRLGFSLAPALAKLIAAAAFCGFASSSSHFGDTPHAQPDRQGDCPV